jgi:hypothetical protein
MVQWQQQHGARGAALGHRRAALRGLLFLTAAIAENKRIPSTCPRRIRARLRLLHRIHAMKMGLFMLAEFIEIAIISAPVHDAVPGRLQPAVHARRGFTLPGGGTWDRLPPRRGGAAAAVLAFLVKVFLIVQLPDPGALDAAALPLRPADAFAGLEVPAAAGGGQPGGHGRALVDAMNQA